MMRRAMLMLLDQPRKVDETAAFSAGLAAAGFSVHREIREPQKSDILVCWNRQGREHTIARRFEAARARVLVAENGYLGAKWAGRRWYALAVGHHNGPGMWGIGGPERWDSWGVQLEPMRVFGLARPLILAQRGIGEPQLREPDRWLEDAVRATRGDIRRHPGTNADDPLERALIGRDSVVTWSSGAALKAMVLGCHCWHGLRNWIGAPASNPLLSWGSLRIEPDNRLAMFQRLAWAMWNADEIATGEPIRRLTS